MDSSELRGYLHRMLVRTRRLVDFVNPCLPSAAKQPPDGPEWIHEIKHDGFRTRVATRNAP